MEFTLANGMRFPQVGFGVYQGSAAQSKEPIAMAIKAGYRYFDTAAFYKTEALLGEAIRESGLRREDVFIATKVWKTDLGYENVLAAFAASLEKLQTDYVDLYLIHWPKPDPLYPDWKALDLESWRAMEEIYRTGRARAIGVCNFLPHHLDNLLAHCEIAPMADQIEYHPGYTQHAAVDYCRANNILVQAWSPMGRSRVFAEPLVQELAHRYQVSEAKICLQYDLQNGVMPLPKASSMERIRDNLDLMSFAISREDMYRMDCLPQTGWSGEHPDRVTVEPQWA